MKNGWKDIPPVPTSQEFVDIVLSRTQRQLPTVIRPGFKISRIRAFYLRKVKFTAETFAAKMQITLESFPKLSDIHPFHRDLMNTLYDADAFKRSLGAVSTAKGLIENVAKDYVKLIKYAQSLFQCKSLKRAALGRMATICKRLRDPLVYLEQVRQHLGRLPSIDPNTRTLLIAGFPNVGKSSFLRNISRADTAVEPYAFTTKSLFVGHFDYKLLRFQAIDTPGILDHGLEEMNTIEMQAITAIAHLRSAVLYFMDLSEQCGYSVESQISLFKNISPLFSNKLVFIIVNKIDLCTIADLSEEQQSDLTGLLASYPNTQLLTLSCTTQENIMSVRNAVCDALLAERQAAKLKSGTSTSTGEPSGRLADLLKRIHVARPLGGIEREPFIPEAVQARIKYAMNDPDRPKLERDIEIENGGPGVYSVDLKRKYVEIPDIHKHDVMPEIFMGRNVADFIDPDIESKLAALEAEEEKLEGEGFYDHAEGKDEDEGIDGLDAMEEADIRYKADLIREKRQLIRNEAKQRKSLKNRAVIPRSSRTKNLSAMQSSLANAGYDADRAAARARSKSRPRAPSRGRSAAVSEDADAMDVDGGANSSRAALLARSRSRTRGHSVSNRRDDGVKGTEEGRTKADRLAKLAQKKMNRMARQGEADRHTTASLTKHLVTGKRGIGKTQRR